MGGEITWREATKSSRLESYRYATPVPETSRMKLPSGVDAMLCGPATARTPAPKTLAFSARGARVLATIFHKVPSDISTCGPCTEEAIICGVINAKLVLN